jgi:hypothetical protein
MITGLIDYFNYINGKFECFAGKYYLGKATNHLDLAQLMVEHGLADKAAGSNFNNAANKVFNDALGVYNWKVNAGYPFHHLVKGVA